MYTSYLASNGLIDRLASAPWWWSITAGLLMLLTAFGLTMLNKRLSKDDDDADTSCMMSLIALLFGAAGVLAVFNGLFGW